MKYKKAFHFLAMAVILSLLVMPLSASLALAVEGYIELSPTTGPVAASINMFGSGFTPSSVYTVHFGDTTAAKTNVYIEADGTFYDVITVPSLSPGLYGVWVTTSNGDTSNYVYFTITVSAQITLSSNSGNVAAGINISGSGFTPGSIYTVHFGDTTATTSNVYIEADGTFYDIFTVPSLSPSTYPVWVTTSNGVTSNTVSFTISMNPLITLSSNSGNVGGEFEVSGVGFSPSSTVRVYFDGNVIGNQLSTTSTGSFADATFTTPETYRGSHTIKARDVTTGIDSPGLSYSVEPKIAISSTSGGVGDQVIASGNGFKANSSISIYFDQQSIAMGAVTTNSLGSFSSATFTVPAGAYGNHSVKAQDTSGYSATATYALGQKMSLSPTSGPVGTSVTVSGTGFRANTTISIKVNNVPVVTNPSPLLTAANGSFSGTFTVTSGTAGNYTVEVSDGTLTATSIFIMVSQAIIEPQEGHVGTEVKVSGTGYAPNAVTRVRFDDIEVATATVDASGSFAAAFKAPPAKGGGHSIIATDGINTKQLAFVMESTPPQIPSPLEPEMGAKAKAQAQFSWGEVTDPSLPVTYTLRIATDESFSNMVLEKTGLTNSEYTLTKEERLSSTKKEAPYYWRVRAVDGASNESDWSNPKSFQVGFIFELTGWVLYTLMGIAGLLLFLIGYWLGKRAAYY